MVREKSFCLLVGSLVSLTAVATMGSARVKAADFVWSGTCGIDWHQSCGGSLCNVTENWYWYHNNWGGVVCGAAPPPPGASDRAFLTGDVVRTSAGVSVYGLFLDAASDLGIYASTTFALTGPLVSNDGTITVNYDRQGAPTALRFDSDATLGGTGTVVLNRDWHEDQAQLNTGPGFTLTHAAGHTVRGRGQINALLINDGTIDSDLSDLTGQTLVLRTNAKTNNGLMRASGGGYLDVAGITITQGPSALLLADGGTARLQGGATIVGGTLETANNGAIVNNSGTNTLTDVTNLGSFNIIVGTTTAVTGTLTNNGTVTVNRDNAGSPTALRFDSDATLAGTGTVVLNQDWADDQASLDTGAGFTLTHAAGHTVRGKGRITAALINEGMIHADLPGKALALRSNAKTNNATIKATDGAFLDIFITLTQGPSALLLADGGTVRLQGGAAIVGGTLETANNGAIVNNSGTNTLTDVTNLGSFNIIVGTTTAVTGTTLTNNGTVAVNTGLGSPTVLRFDSEVTLTGTGTVVLNPNWHPDQAQLNTSAGFTLTHAAGHTVRGWGWINAALVNEGMIHADLPGKALVLRSNAKTSNATIKATDGGYLDVAGITITQGPSALLLADGGTARLQGGATIVGGTLDTANNGAIVNNSGTNTLTDVTNLGSFNIIVGTTTAVTGTLTNNGTVTVNRDNAGSPTALRFDSDATLAGTGAVVLNPNWHPDQAQLNTAAGFTLTHAAGHTVRGWGWINAALVNRGTIAADVSGRLLEVNPPEPGITNVGTLRVAGGATLRINNANLFTQTGGVAIADGTLTVNGAPFNLAGGTLRGIGTVAGGVSNTGGTVEPGGSVGTLSITGSYTQSRAARLRIELGGPTPGSEYDRLTITGAAALGGELRIDPVGGYRPPVGQQFTILIAGSVTGEFATVTGSGVYGVTYNPQNVVLTVVVPPVTGDWDEDLDIDLDDHAAFGACMSGPWEGPDFVLPAQDCRDAFDFDADTDVDLSDWARFQTGFTG